MRQDAQNKNGNERAEEFFHRSENIIAFKKPPFGGLVSAVYYNCGVLVLLTAVLTAIALALLRYGRRLDDLTTWLLQLLRRALRVIGTWSHPAVPSRRFS